MTRSGAAKTGLLALLPLIVLAINLRPALTSVGPLLEPIRASTGLSIQGAGILSSLPLILFAICALLGGVHQRIGIKPAVIACLTLIACGIAIRSIGTSVWLFGGTFLAAAGIAIANVMMPTIIKLEFANRSSGMTTLYAVAMSLAAASASGLAVPMANVLDGDWRLALAVWILPVVLAIAVWTLKTMPAKHPGRLDAASPQPRRPVWQVPLAWLVTLFMGLQSMFFYTAIAWFPTILKDFGYSAVDAGWLVTLFQMVGLASTVATPLISRMFSSQSPVALLASGLIATSLLGLAIYPSQALIWTGLFGAGAGSCLVLSLSFIPLRTTDHRQAASLSIMSQSIGYLIAAVGTFLTGQLHDLFGNWTVPIIVLAALACAQALLGYGAGKTRTLT